MYLMKSNTATMTRMTRTSRDITTAMMTPVPLEGFVAVDDPGPAGDGPGPAGAGGVVVKGTTNKH